MNFTQKHTDFYECKNCDFKCFKNSDWVRHISTAKHQNRTSLNKITPKNADVFICKKCSKKYKARNSLWYHEKKCQYVNDIANISENVKEDVQKDEQFVSNDVILEILKQNQEFQKLILEQNKQIIELSKKNSITNNSNCYNKTKFNLHFFLNEQCKDALNIMDFVNDLQVKVTDLEQVGQLGYVEGISKIFINGLKQLDVFKRPIHCSDLKREVLYVKDQNAWEKDNEENKKITNAIHCISNKNIKQISKWVEQNPNCKDSESKKNDQYLHIIGESMGGIEPTNIEKIIHNIAKEVVIDKL